MDRRQILLVSGVILTLPTILGLLFRLLSPLIGQALSSKHEFISVEVHFKWPIFLMLGLGVLLIAIGFATKSVAQRSGK